MSVYRLSYRLIFLLIFSLRIRLQIPLPIYFFYLFIFIETLWFHHFSLEKSRSQKQKLIKPLMDYLVIWVVWIGFVKDGSIHLFWPAWFISMDFVAAAIRLLRGSQTKVEILGISMIHYTLQSILYTLLIFFHSGQVFSLIQFGVLMFLSLFMLHQVYHCVPKEEWKNIVQDS